MYMFGNENDCSEEGPPIINNSFQNRFFFAIEIRHGGRVEQGRGRHTSKSLNEPCFSPNFAMGPILFSVSQHVIITKCNQHHHCNRLTYLYNFIHLHIFNNYLLLLTSVE